jgi:hypothetical protein
MGFRGKTDSLDKRFRCYCFLGKHDCRTIKNKTKYVKESDMGNPMFGAPGLGSAKHDMCLMPPTNENCQGLKQKTEPPTNENCPVLESIRICAFNVYTRASG